MEAISFKNWTNEDFEWKFNGNPYKFKAGQEIYLEADRAELFTKHLVDRELNRLGLPTNSPKRGELESKCLGGEVVTSLEALNLNKKAEKGKVVKKEEEFPDLKKKKK